MINVYIETLGCAKNTVYSEYIAGLLSKNKAFQLTEDPSTAHIIIVNTCGFITAAKEESINALLEMSSYKDNGVCQKIVALGCMVQKYAKELQEAMPEIDYLIGTTAYDELDKLIENVQTCDKDNIYVDSNWRLPAPGGYHNRQISTPKHYAYLSIAEGCNNRCTYCAIPDMQGPYRSRKIEDIIAEAKELAANGHHELIIIAQDTTYYGLDLYQKPSLAELLSALCKIDDLHWIRVLYAYPDHFTDELIHTMATEEKICHYIDIPFQHANNEILKAMNRHITQEEIVTLVKKLRRAMPDIMIRSTFITGFPGETDEQFNDLLDFLQKMKLERVGVFPYSQEDHTPAGIREDQIPEEIREKRAATLMEVQYQVMYDCHLSRMNCVYEVVVEERSEDVEGLLLCRSQGEAPDIDPFVLVYDTSHAPGNYLSVKIIGVDEYDLVGEVVQ